MSYAPKPVPGNELITREFQRVADAMRVVHQHDVISSLPEKLRPGLVVYCDGVGADPLSTGNEGLYLYKSTGWVFIG